MKANNGYKIRKDRELKGFTQDYLVGKLEMSQHAYSKIEINEIKLDRGRIE
jgi:transcriptional regulator with XRE-family HTH domain